MADMHAKTFRFVRYQYNVILGSWKQLESDYFLTHSKSAKGVARQVKKVVPHVNRETDLIMFDGVYLTNRDIHVCGLWCPVMNLLEAFEYTDQPPQEFVNLRRNCIRYIVNHHS